MAWRSFTVLLSLVPEGMPRWTYRAIGDVLIVAVGQLDEDLPFHAFMHDPEQGLVVLHWGCGLTPGVRMDFLLRNASTGNKPKVILLDAGGLPEEAIDVAVYDDDTEEDG